ncbi:AAC(3) family N-acetyltransferase [soil metagenome]
MSELALIESTPEPRTRASIADDLGALGVTSGSTLLVHSSLKSIGWVSGGPVSVIQALLDVVGDDGTLVTPAHTGNNSDPANWAHPPVPESWWQVIRDTSPAFDPRLTATNGMGVIAELFRSWPGTLRSNHPVVSFAAKGTQAEFITTGHGLSNSLGETSPLARVYELGGQVLLLGVEYDRNTSFHLAEYRAVTRPRVETGAAFYRDGERVWDTFSDIEFGDEVFPAIGQELDESGLVTIGKVGSATARLFDQAKAVDFAEAWFKSH